MIDALDLFFAAISNKDHEHGYIRKDLLQTMNIPVWRFNNLMRLLKSTGMVERKYLLDISRHSGSYFILTEKGKQLMAIMGGERIGTNKVRMQLTSGEYVIYPSGDKYELTKDPLKATKMTMALVTTLQDMYPELEGSELKPVDHGEMTQEGLDDILKGMPGAQFGS